MPEARTQVYLVFSESYELRAEVRSGWCKMLREGCEDKKLLLETEFTDCYSAVVSSRLRIKEIKLQQFVVTFLLTGVKP